MHHHLDRRLSRALSAAQKKNPSYLPRAQIDVEPTGRKGRVERVDALVLVDANGRRRGSNHERFRLHRFADKVEVLLRGGGGSRSRRSTRSRRLLRGRHRWRGRVSVCIFFLSTRERKRARLLLSVLSLSLKKEKMTSACRRSISPVQNLKKKKRRGIPVCTLRACAAAPSTRFHPALRRDRRPQRLACTRFAEDSSP